MKKSSKYAKKDEVVKQKANMDKKKFLQMCGDLVVPAIRKLLKEKLRNVKRVTVQIDNAGGHGGGRGDMRKVVEELNKLAKNQPGLAKISFECQPPRSPDLNVLDLGIWFSLAAGVRVSLLDETIRKSKKVIDRLIAAVTLRWEEWDATHRLESIYETKTRIIQAVLEAEGAIDYDIPRSPASHTGAERASFVPNDTLLFPSKDNEDESEDMNFDEADEDNDGEGLDEFEWEESEGWAAEEEKEEEEEEEKEEGEEDESSD